MTPSVAVSIVVHKSPAEKLIKVIQCVLRSEPVGRIYVIDNGPDETLRMAVEGFSKVEYRHIPNNGYGAGHNIALRESLNTNVDYHLVVNPDVWWEGDVITPLADYMSAHPMVGMTMPKTFYPDGDLQLTARRLPTPLDVFAKRFLPKALTKRLIERYLLADADHDVMINSPYLLGSFMMLSCKALKHVGVFDERFFMYPEDIDMTRRIHERYDSIYYPYVSIVHEHAAASRKNWRMLKIHIINMIRYFNKWGWFFDSKRRRANQQLEKSIHRIPKESQPPQRG